MERMIDAAIDEAAKALYEFYCTTLILPAVRVPTWDETEEDGKDYWRTMYRKGYEAHTQSLRFQIAKIKGELPGSATGRIQ